MDKSPDAFRTISEVAEHLETPAHVLRFWESRFPQIRPVKRAGGRRYYRPSDVALLTGIKQLLHDEGMTIRGVQKILREQGVRHVASLGGEYVDGDAVDHAAFADQSDDQVAEVVVPLRAEPAAVLPRPGPASALAKVVDRGRQPNVPVVAANPPLPLVEPAQGALLLTPASVRKPASAEVPASAEDPTLAEVPVFTEDPASAEDPAFAEVPAPNEAPGADPVAADVTGADASDTATPAERDLAEEGSGVETPAAPPSVFPETDPNSDDFDADDADDGPVTTLAARIRSLPEGASATHVRAELLTVVSRLQALRDKMTDASLPSRF